MKKTGHHLETIATACAVMLAAFAGALSWSCRGQDQIAPEGSKIDLAANPTTIVLVGGSGTSDVVATVSSAVGAPLKDQDVRFTSSAGSLFTESGDPGANIPIRTDDLGNAHVMLVTTKTTTVTARSGAANGSLTLDTVAGNITSIALNQVFGTGCLSDPTFQSCSENFCLEAQVIDDEGLGISGVLVIFKIQNAESTTGDPVSGVFTPTQATTDVNGIAKSSFRLSSSCPDVCGGGESCFGEFIASLQGGGFPSEPVPFDTAIP